MKKRRPDAAPNAQSARLPQQIIERAVEISRKRRAYLNAMRKAIRTGDKDSVFELARKLTGLSDEGRHRTDTRLS
jgi:hypothetical protein